MVASFLRLLYINLIKSLDDGSGRRASVSATTATTTSGAVSTKVSYSIGPWRSSRIGRRGRPARRIRVGPKVFLPKRKVPESRQRPFGPMRRAPGVSRPLLRRQNNWQPNRRRRNICCSEKHPIRHHGSSQFLLLVWQNVFSVTHVARARRARHR